MRTTVRLWFVRDIGIVKMSYTIGGSEAVLELVRYEQGK